MADTVTTQTIADTSGVKYVVKLTNVSDGTGENLVNKVDASELTFMSEDGARKIARIYWSINTTDTKSAVELYWEIIHKHVSNNNVLMEWDLRLNGNGIPNNATTPTGDVLLSTKNFSKDDNYTIIVEFR